MAELKSNQDVSGLTLFAATALGAGTMVATHFLNKPTEYKHPETPIKITDTFKKGARKLVGRL